MKQYVKLLCLLISIQQTICKNYFDTLKININNYDLKDLIGYHTSHIKAITQSYKKLAVEYHPDKAPSNYLQAYFDKVFKEIGNAKSFLTTLDSKNNRTLVQGYVQYSVLLKIFEENQIEIFDTYKGSKSNPIDRTKAISNIQDWISQLAKIITTLNDSAPFQNILNSYKAILATIKATPQPGSVDFVQRTDPDIVATISRITTLLDQFNASADSSNLLILDEIRDNYLYFLIVLSEKEPLKQRYLEAELLSKRQLENATKSETNDSKKVKFETFIKNRFDTLLSFIDTNWNGIFAASLTPSLQQLLATLKGQPQILSAQELLKKINEKIQQGDTEKTYEQSQLFYDNALELLKEYQKVYGPAATWKILAIYVKKLEKLKAWNVDSVRKSYIYDVLIKNANEFINNAPEEIKNGDKFKTELTKYEALKTDIKNILAPPQPSTQPTKRPLPSKPIQSRTPSLEDRQKATQDIPGLEGVKDNGFLASFLGDGSSIIIPQPISYPGMPQLLTILPQLGQYSDQYPTQNILGLLQLNPATMGQSLPAEIKNKLPNNIQNFNLNILISGTLDRPISGLTYNFVLHPWVYGIMKTNYFNVNPTAGFYLQQGINIHDLGNDQQQPLNVNAHNGGAVYFSPDNGKFTIQPGREISTFWSIALYNNNALITFHIVVNSPQVQNNFIQAGQQAPFIGAYLQNIERTIIPTLTTEADKNTLTNAVTTIKAMLAPQITPVVPPQLTPVQQQTIQRELKQFENSLRKLAGAL